MTRATPTPLDEGDLDGFFRRMAAGADYRSAIEELMLELPLERAQELMLFMCESRGAWIPLMTTSGSRALFLGNAFSGTVTALDAAGFEVTVYDHSPERLRLAEVRGQVLASRTLHLLLSEDAPRLPFADDAFDLVVLEEGSPSGRHDHPFPLAECRRVAAGDYMRIADNLLGYKQSVGRCGEFAVPTPPQFLRSLLSPDRGQQTPFRDRRAMRFAGCEAPRVWSLYPHSRDFTFVVGVDDPRPELLIGPKERLNHVKMLGKRLGLFGLFAPSFAISSRPLAWQGEARRIDRLLERLASELGEDVPEIEHWIATRGNAAVIQTRPRAGEVGGAGSWTIHLPLCPSQERLTRRHHRAVRALRKSHPWLAVPELLFEGEIEGAWLTAERRLAGCSGAQISGEAGAVERMVEGVADDLARLVVEEHAEITETLFAEHVTARFDIVRPHATLASSRAKVEELHALARERMLGQPLPLVFFHGDLRGKHVQVETDGSVVGYMDWGSSLERGLPLFDLLHLIVQEHHQVHALPTGESWEVLLRSGGLAGADLRAVETYCERVGVTAPMRGALMAIYPVLVASVAEENWDYSRPRWLDRELGL